MNGLILCSVMMESVFLMVLSRVIGRTFCGGPFVFPGFGIDIMVPLLISKG